MRFCLFGVWLLAFCRLLAQDTLYGHKPGYYLVWHDEFNPGSNLDDKWERLFPWGPYAGEHTYSVAYGNHQIDEHGFMNLFNRQERFYGEVAEWDSAGNYTPYYRYFDYTSAMLFSKQGFLNGYFETRFQSDVGKGFFNAFWLYGVENQEIDIFELAGSLKNDAQMTLHWKDKDPFINSSQSFTHLKAPQNFDQGFHDFGVLWLPEELTWYYNKQPVQESAFTRFIRSRHIPDKPMHLILNSSVATLDGLPDSTTNLPGKISFDYVRVYRNDTLVDPPQISQVRYKYFLSGEKNELNRVDLLVTHHYQSWPYGFNLEILEGENYSITSENQFIVDGTHTDTLYLNVRVNDGRNYSPVFKMIWLPQVVGNISSEQPAKHYFEWNYSEKSLQWFFPDNHPKSIQFYDVTGRCLYTVVIDGQNKINIPPLQTGIYTAVLRGSNKVLAYRRIII